MRKIEDSPGLNRPGPRAVEVIAQLASLVVMHLPITLDKLLV